MEQFEYDGCDNCESFLRMKKNKDRVMDCTSNNFDGMIAVMSPEDSWVCKWQRISMILIALNHKQYLMFILYNRSFYQRSICDFSVWTIT